MSKQVLGNHYADSGRVSQQLETLAWDRCIPISATLEITLACNLKCVHCYNFDRAEPVPKERARGYLSSAEITRTLEQLADAGCLYLDFSGGEALLHPDLMHFIRVARGRHMKVGLKTNGMLMTSELAKELVELGVASFELSLYGSTAEVHDAFTTVRGSFDKTLAGAHAIHDAGGHLRFNVSLTRHNVHQAEEILALGDPFGTTVRIDPQLTARYDGTQGSLDHRVGREALAAAYAGPLRSLLPTPNLSPTRGVQCACARSTCGIASNGDVYPCIGAPIVSGNLREQTFETIWRESPQFQEIRQLALQDFEACEPCPHRGYCRRSSGTVFTNTGNYCGADPWTCMEAEVLHDLLGQ